MSTAALPPVVDADAWQRQLDELRAREKAATRELDAIAAQRRRLPMVKMPDYTLVGEQGPVRLADVFGGKSQLIVYNHMWFPGEQWQCPGCTGFTSQFTRLEFLDSYDARFVIVTQGPIGEALAYKRRVRCQRVPARRRHGLSHLAHQRPWHRAAQPQLRADRSAALRAAGGMAGLARGLAAVAHLQPVGRLPGHRRGLRPRRLRTAGDTQPRRAGGGRGRYGGGRSPCRGRPRPGPGVSRPGRPASWPG